jgi:hypothetical protein
MPLSDTKIRNAKPKAKQYNLNQWPNCCFRAWRRSIALPAMRWWLKFSLFLNYYEHMRLSAGLWA